MKKMLVILTCCIAFGCGKQPIQPCINEETLGEINTKIDVLTTEIARLQKNERIWITELPDWIALFKWMAFLATYVVFCTPLLDKLIDKLRTSSLLVRIGYGDMLADKKQ